MTQTTLPTELKLFNARLVVETLINKFPKDKDYALYIQGSSDDETLSITDIGQGTDGTALWIEDEVQPKIHQDKENIYLDITTVSDKCLSYLVEKSKTSK